MERRERDSERVGIVVADDHPLYRDALVRVLREQVEIEVVGEAADGREALDRLREVRPDVAVLDVGLPDIDGFGVLEEMRRESLPTRVVFLSAHDDSATMYRAIAHGADAYLAKSAKAVEIVRVILRVARGEIVISPSVQEGLVREIRLRRDDDLPALSARELEVLRLAADGLSSVEIGERLHLSRTTVRTHLQHVYEKLGVGDRTAAVAQALRSGLLH
jgi:two-component system, NarL family, nitrate/nitrite response regulator NarL